MSYPTIRTISNFKLREQHNAVIAQAKLLRLIELIRFMKNPRNVTDIAKQMKMTTRSAYRYLHLLEAFGIYVSKDDYDRYSISKEKCPCCGNNF